MCALGLKLASYSCRHLKNKRDNLTKSANDTVARALIIVRACWKAKNLISKSNSKKIYSTWIFKKKIAKISHFCWNCNIDSGIDFWCEHSNFAYLVWNETFCWFVNTVATTMYHLDAKKIAPFSYKQIEKLFVVQRYISVKIKVRETRRHREKWKLLSSCWRSCSSCWEITNVHDDDPWVTIHTSLVGQTCKKSESRIFNVNRVI